MQKIQTETEAAHPALPLATFIPLASAMTEKEQAVQKQKVDVLLQQLQKEQARHKRRRRYVLFGVVLFVFVMLAIPILVWAFTGHITGATFGSFSATFGLLGLAGVSQSQKNAAGELARLPVDTRAVGALAESLEYGDPALTQLASEALVQLLPQLKASDAGLLNTEQRACLNRALLKENKILVGAILKGYEQVGGEAEGGVLEKLALGSGKVKTEEVRAEAMRCLEFIQQRAEQRRQSQSLLRASTLPASSETLLRPVLHDIATPDSNHLLRAANTSEQTPP